MTPTDRRRLARLLGMLGSEFDGERAAAGLQAEAFRKKHGLTWEQMLSLPAKAVEVVMPAPEPPTPPPPPPPPRPQPPRPPEPPVAEADPVMATEWQWVSLSRPSKPIGYTVGIASFWLFVFVQALRPITNYCFGFDF